MRCLRAFACLVNLFFILSICCLAHSQQTTQSAPSPAEIQAKHDRIAAAHVAPLKDFEQFVPYWTAEGGWHTDLQLRNNLSSGNLVVTPALRTADGAETPLNPITLLPGEVQSINLHDALAAVNSSLGGSANAYGSIVLRYNSKGLGNLYASVMVHDTGHPIMYHLDATNQSPGYVAGSREGIWWLPTKSTRDYLILTNQADHPLQGTLWLYDGAGRSWSQPLQLGPRQTQRLSVRQLVGTAGFFGQYGGIKVEVPNGAGSLDTAHLLYDETAGFSATMKMFDYDPRSTLAQRDFAQKGRWTTRAPMLALSKPDPVLAFPANTVLQPMLLVRNTSKKTVKVDVSFHWRNASKDGRVSLPELTLAPFESRKIDVGDLQQKGTLPLDAYWAQVSLSTDTLPDEVMAVAASYDATLRYGAQTPFSDQLIAHLEGGQWRVDANHTSLIAAGNGGDKPVTAALTFFYDQGRKRYRLERTIAANDQWWVNIGDLIRNQTPDKSGSTLPSDLTSGAYQLREVGDPQDLLYEGKVITDKTYGSATYGCAVCCGYDGASPFFVADPTGVIVYGSRSVDVYASNNCSGNNDGVNTYFPTWSSWDTSVLTAADRYVTGVAPGSTTVQANATRLPAGDGQPYRRGCPALPAQGTGGGFVMPSLSISQLQYTNSVAVWQDSPSNPTPTAMSQIVWTSSSTLPSVFVSGSQIAATATFNVTPAPTTDITGASIEGNVAGLGTLVATGVTIPAGASSVTVSNLTGNTAFPASTTQYYSGLGITWSFSSDGQSCSSPDSQCTSRVPHRAQCT